MDHEHLTSVPVKDAVSISNGVSDLKPNGISDNQQNAAIDFSDPVKDETSSKEDNDIPVENFRPMKVIVIGAGFSGIYCGVRIPQRLRNVNLCIYEKNSGVGGTWFENRYPGCACDIPAHSYQYTFSPNPDWSSFYAPSEEIRKYLEGIVQKYSVGRYIKCSHKVLSVRWRDDLLRWIVTVQNLETNEQFEDEADVVVSARGTLNDIAWPSVPGLGDLTIPVMHSAAWDQNYNFEGKRVGIIGGGSSAIQIIPALQKVKGTHLSCFIRSRTWISRPFGDHVMEELGIKDIHFSPEQTERFKNDSEHYLKFRSIIERDGNSIHGMTLKGSDLQKLMRQDFSDLMKARLEKKPEILKSILPSFSVGCRRLTPGPGYLEALVEENVDFIDIPIVKAHSGGLELQNGQMIDLDVLVCATGFRTAAPPPFPVIGRHAQTMEDKFHPYPETYLSLATDGFPNYFMMLGPNAAIGTGPLTTMMEMEGDYIIKCIRKMQKENIRTMEVQKKRVKDFSRIVDRYFERTVYLDSCTSWYKRGTNGRITGLWPGSALHAMETFRSPRWEDFDYVYQGEEDGSEHEVNHLGWLGNGWSAVQLDSTQGDLAYFLQPGHVDIPAHPLPEKTVVYQQRAFSY